MNLKDFFKQFPTEEACKSHFKQYRDTVGVTCKKCKCKDHYWLSTTSYYKCKQCGFRTSLKSGTVMENSKLSFLQWYMAFQFATTSKKSFSALEIQRQIDHKYYEPIWYMMHKIRNVMGKRDAEYQLAGNVEIDEGFFIATPPIEKDEYGRRIPKKKNTKVGKGSPRTATVLVMAESIPNQFNKNKHRPSSAVKHIKMIRIDDTKASSVLPEIKKSVKKEALVITDGANHYNGLKDVVKHHIPYKLNNTTTQGHEVLPWVHKVISNAKRNLIGVHHSVGKAYTQNYLNEFCWRFNRRYNDIEPFDRILNVAVQYEWGN
jgi:transposase-like protein